jgi:hypothetical protein
MFAVKNSRNFRVACSPAAVMMVGNLGRRSFS